MRPLSLLLLTACLLMSACVGVVVLPPQPCRTCGGDRWLSVKTPRTVWLRECEWCQGRGRTTLLCHWRWTPIQTCPVCKGSGRATLPVFRSDGERDGWRVDACDLCESRGWIHIP